MNKEYCLDLDCHSNNLIKRFLFCVKFFLLAVFNDCGCCGDKGSYANVYGNNCPVLSKEVAIAGLEKTAVRSSGTRRFYAGASYFNHSPARQVLTHSMK